MLGIMRTHGLNKGIAPSHQETLQDSPPEKRAGLLGKEATVSIPGRQRTNKEGVMTLACPRHLGIVKPFHSYPCTPDPWCNFKLSLEYPQDNLLHFQIWNMFQMLQRCRIPKRMPREFTQEKKISSGTNF